VLQSEILLQEELEGSLLEAAEKTSSLQTEIDNEELLLGELADKVSRNQARLAELEADVAPAERENAALQAQLQQVVGTKASKERDLADIKRVGAEKELYAQIRVDKREKALLEELLELQEQTAAVERVINELRQQVGEDYRNPMAIFTAAESDQDPQPYSAPVKELEETVAELQKLHATTNVNELQQLLRHHQDQGKAARDKLQRQTKEMEGDIEALEATIAELAEEARELGSKAHEITISSPATVPYLLRTPQWTRTLGILRGEAEAEASAAATALAKQTPEEEVVVAAPAQLEADWIRSALAERQRTPPKPRPYAQGETPGGQAWSELQVVTATGKSGTPDQTPARSSRKITRAVRPTPSRSTSADRRSGTSPVAPPVPLTAKERLALQKKAINKRASEEAIVKMNALQHRLWRGRRGNSPDPEVSAPQSEEEGATGKSTSVRRGTFFGMYKEPSPPPKSSSPSRPGTLTAVPEDRMSEEYDHTMSVNGDSTSRSKRHRDSTREPLVARERGWGMRGQAQYLLTRHTQQHHTRDHAAETDSDASESPGPPPPPGISKRPGHAAGVATPDDIDSDTSALLEKYRAIVADEAPGSARSDRSDSRPKRPPPALSRLETGEKGARLTSLRPPEVTPEKDRLSSPKRQRSTRGNDTGIHAANVISAHAVEFFENSLRSAAPVERSKSAGRRAPPPPQRVVAPKQQKAEPAREPERTSTRASIGDSARRVSDRQRAPLSTPKGPIASRRASDASSEHALDARETNRPAPPSKGKARPTPSSAPRSRGANLFAQVEREDADAARDNFMQQHKAQMRPHKRASESPASHNSSSLLTLESIAEADDTSLFAGRNRSINDHVQRIAAIYNEEPTRNGSSSPGTRVHRTNSASSSVSNDSPSSKGMREGSFKSLASTFDSFASLLRPASKPSTSPHPSPPPRSPTLTMRERKEAELRAEAQLAATNEAIAAACAALGTGASTGPTVSPGYMTKYLKSADPVAVTNGGTYVEAYSSRYAAVPQHKLGGLSSPGVDREAANSLLDAAQAFLMMQDAGSQSVP
jgi:hypothetical protein